MDLHRFSGFSLFFGTLAGRRFFVGNGVISDNLSAIIAHN